MATGYNPKIVTDGLVLCLDKRDQNSYAGEPTTNTLTYPQLTGISNQTVGASSITKTDFGNGLVGVEFVQGGTGDIVSLSVQDNYTPTSGDTITFSAYLNSTVTGNLLKSQVTVYVNGTRYWLQSDETWSTTVHEYREFFSPTVTGEWHRVTKTITMPTGTLTTFVIGGKYRTTGNFTLKIANLQLETNSHATKFTTTSRSSTDGWKDLSGNNNHGDLTSLTYSATNIPGTPNNDFSFDGSSDYVNLNASGAPGGSNGTVCAWVKLSGAANNHASIFTNQVGAAWNAMRLALNIKTPNQVYFHLANGSSATQFNILSSALSYNQYYYIVGTYDGTTGKIYVNGDLEDSYTTSIVPGTYTTGFEAVGFMNYSNRYFPGNIDIIHRYNITLTDNEIKQNFNAQRSRFGV